MFNKKFLLYVNGKLACYKIKKDKSVSDTRYVFSSKAIMEYIDTLVKDKDTIKIVEIDR